MHNFVPPQAVLAPQVFATLQWLQDAGVTALVGDDFNLNLGQAPVLQAMPASRSETVPAVAVPSLRNAVPETRSAWTQDVAGCQDLESLNAYLAAYKGLGLCLTATQAVLGRGQSHRPTIMIIAEAPDASEDQSGQPFSGVAHKMQEKAVFYAHGSTDDLYFTYLSKWRPPGQRSLSPPELDLCQAVIQREITLVQPHHIITLSETTLRAVTKGLESWEKAEKLTFSGLEGGVGNNIYDIVFKEEKNKNSLKNRLLGLQKPEAMLRDSGNKKRVWLSLLSFCRALTT